MPQSPGGHGTSDHVMCRMCPACCAADLFPGVAPPPADYAALHGAIKRAAAARNLQATDYFLLKVGQGTHACMATAAAAARLLLLQDCCLPATRCCHQHAGNQPCLMTSA